MARKVIFRNGDRVRIVLDEEFCPRCRYVAAKELLDNLKMRDSSNPGAAVKAFKIEESNAGAKHTHDSKCHASKDWAF